MKKRTIFKILRLSFYAIFFIFFVLYPTENIISGSTICIIKRFTGRDCPTCGVTRAFSSIMHFNFSDALKYNPVFTLIICPIALIIIFQDIYSIIKSFIKHDNNDKSLLTFIMELL